MVFDAVQYTFDRSSDKSELVELTALPEIYIIVGEHAYFADSDGYLTVMPIEAVQSFMVDVSGEYRYAAINAKWFDESDYGPLVPEEMIVANETVAAALTALHDMHETFRGDQNARNAG